MMMAFILLIRIQFLHALKVFSLLYYFTLEILSHDTVRCVLIDVKQPEFVATGNLLNSTSATPGRVLQTVEIVW